MTTIGDSSAQLHSETEIPGRLFDRDTLDIIRFRYDFAATYVKGKQVLEIGSGPGLGLEYLGQQAAWLIEAEYSEENIKIWRRCNPASKHPLVRMDAHHIPFPDGSFDVIIALAMVYYLRFEEFLLEVRRVLKPGGHLVFCTSNRDVPGFVAAPFTTHYYGVPEMAYMLRQGGFTPTFFGAFKAYGGNFLVACGRAVIKVVLKKIIWMIPGGRNLWRKLRNEAKGEKFDLPSNVLQILRPEENVVVLPEDRPDRVHRVIYSAASRD